LDTFPEKWWCKSRKSTYATLKIADYSKTGNMAETCKIDFSYPTSYSSSTVTGSGTHSACANVKQCGLRNLCASVPLSVFLDVQ